MSIEEQILALAQHMDTLTLRVDAMAGRVDAMAGRVDALTQSMELLSSLHRDFEARERKRASGIARVLVRIMETNNRLGRMLEQHGVQLDDHERRLGDLEG